MTLVINNIETYYGQSQVLFGLSLEIPSGKAVTLLGRNGMGKTTTVNTIIGNVRCARGEIFYNREKISDLPSYQIARKGIAVVPEGRQIFPNLTVRENLIATAANYAKARTPWTLSRVVALFPQLQARLTHMGEQLSGGEQQMLAIARALMLNPRLLILDEVSEGLAPLVQRDLWQKLQQIKQSGVSLLLIDKHIAALSEIADYHYLMQKGAIVWHGDCQGLRENPQLKTRYLGV